MSRGFIAAAAMLAVLALAVEGVGADRPRRAERAEAAEPSARPGRRPRPARRGAMAGDRPALTAAAPGRGGMRGMRGRVLTNEQERELLAALKEHRREVYDRLIGIRGDSPGVYRQSLWRAWRWYEHWKDMSEQARKALGQQERARRRIWQLLKALRDGGPRSELTDQLRQAVAEQFDAEQELRKDKLAQLVKQIERIRAELQQRNKDRADIVQTRMDRLLQASVRPLRGLRALRRDPVSRPMR